MSLGFSVGIAENVEKVTKFWQIYIIITADHYIKFWGTHCKLGTVLVFHFIKYIKIKFYNYDHWKDILNLLSTRKIEG